jgi:hypothetical protein
MDAGLDRLHDMVSRRLGGDPALARLSAEAAERGEVGGRTRQRVALAVEEAAERDPGFAAAVSELVAHLRADGDGPMLVAGSVDIRASGHGVAAGVIDGQVWTANPPGPGPAAPRRHPATN